MATRVLHRPLVDHLLPLEGGVVRVAVQVTLGVLLLAGLAQLRLEIGPVPVTGQTLGVLLLGATYGVGPAFATVGAYLVVGGLGLPVFANAGLGWSTFTGTTGGYLVGFLLAATAVAYLAQRGWTRSYARMAGAMILGNLIIYLCGLTWLSGFAPDLATTLAWGLWPFLVGDLIKLLVAVSLVPTVWKWLGRQ